MRKISAFIIAISLCITFILLALPVKTAFASTENDSLERLSLIHQGFITEFSDRQSFVPDGYDYQTEQGERKGDQLAADYVVQRLDSLGAQYSNTEIIVQPFSEQFSAEKQGFFTPAEVVTRWSQNVIFRITNPNTDKRLIIGASLDNIYNYTGSGALYGAGAAILMLLAEQLAGEELPFSVDLVFFGASHYDGTPYYIGAEHYASSHSFGSIIAMINIGRIGGENTYAYSLGGLQSFATRVGGFKALPVEKLPLLSGGALGAPDNLPYSHYGLSGNHARFIQRGMPALNIFCGDYNGFDLTDRAGSGGVLTDDSLAKMNSVYPNAYGKMTDAFSAVKAMVLSEDIVEAAKDKGANGGIFHERWVAYLIFGALVVIGFILTNYTARALVKKYPPNKPSSAIKINVFSDFE